MKFNQQGSTLIIVMWAIAIIGVVITFMYYRSEAEWASVNSLEQKVRLRREANNILFKCLDLLLEDDTEFDSKKDLWFNGVARIQSAYNDNNKGYATTIIVEDEGSKPNLNTIGEKGLKALGGTAIDPVLDWRDTDDEVRPEGAELSYYQGLNPAYKPRNGFFSSVEELKLLKDEDKTYPALAPEVTVYGKINPNVISAETFSSFLYSLDRFEKMWIERATDEFRLYREQIRQDKLHFTNIDQFGSSAFTIDKRDNLKPYFQFQGNHNPNLMSESGLKAVLTDTGYPETLAAELINRREQQPFENDSELDIYFKPKKKEIRYPTDYFTTVSTIIRYRIWISKGNTRFYLDTVQERRFDRSKKEWRAHPLSWRELFNKEVPDIPKIETEESEITEDGENE